MKRGLRPWPCARVAITLFAIWLIGGGLIGSSLPASSGDFRGWLIGVVPVGLVLPVGVALLASRDSILRWLRIERDGATPAALVSAAIALLAFCEACRVLIGLACSAVFVVADTIVSIGTDPFASIEADFAALPSAHASYGTWGEVAVLLSCLLLVRLAHPIAGLPRATRTSRTSS